MRRFVYIVCWALVLVICVNHGPIRCASANSLGICEDAAAIRDFADWLKARREYYRAVTEYMRFRFLCPTADSGGRISLSICRCYLDGEQFSTSRDCLDEFLGQFPDTGSVMREHAFYLRGRSSLLMRDFEDSRRWFSELARMTEDDDRRLASKIQIIWSWALQRQFHEANEAASAITRQANPEMPWLEAFISDVGQLERLPRVNPTIAALMSSALPGAGHAYCGRYRDSVTAFIVNGLLVWGLSSAINHQDRTDMVVFGAAELFFYSGTIVSAWNSAQKLNKRRELAWLEAMAGRYPLDRLDARWSQDWENN